MANELTDRMVGMNALVDAFMRLRQQALRVMFDNAGRMVKPVERWAELTQINKLWESACTAIKDVDGQLLRAETRDVIDIESVVALTLRRDELQSCLAHYEEAFETELARLLGNPSWPVVTKVLETVDGAQSTEK